MSLKPEEGQTVLKLHWSLGVDSMGKFVILRSDFGGFLNENLVGLKFAVNELIKV